MTDPAELYVELVKRVLLREGFEGSHQELDLDRVESATKYLYGPLQRLLRSRGLLLVSPTPAWLDGDTMLSRARLDHLELCVESVLAEGIPGDLIETGVWRGGAAILMRAVLAAHDDTTRTVWAADSFNGYPSDETRVAIDTTEDFTAGAGDRVFRVGLEQVQRNFARYGLLDDQVRFLAGWFAETLDAAPIEQLAVLRLDGALYQSTREALAALYPNLAVGGYLVVDDYGVFDACRTAVDQFREENGINEPIQAIDDQGVFWRKG
jgi:hypothetical protein